MKTEYRIYDAKTGQDYGSVYASSADEAARSHPLASVRKLVARSKKAEVGRSGYDTSNVPGEIVHLFIGGKPKRDAKRSRSRRDYVVQPPGGKALKSYVHAVDRANAHKRERGEPASVYDDRTGRKVYVARDDEGLDLQALRAIEEGWAHSAAREEISRTVAKHLADRGWIRLAQTARGMRWAVTSRGSYALGTFKFAGRSKSRPRRARDTQGYFPKRRPPSAAMKRAKEKVQTTHKIAKGDRVYTFRSYANRVAVTSPSGERRLMSREAARGLYAARVREGFRKVASGAATCGCPAYPWPHRAGSGCCGHPEKTGCPYRRPGRHR